jgi:hypothetical protein
MPHLEPGQDEVSRAAHLPKLRDVLELLHGRELRCFVDGRTEPDSFKAFLVGFHLIAPHTDQWSFSE